MKRRRIFIAINLPEDVKRKLADYQEKIEELFTLHRSEASGVGPMRWIKPRNIHITLDFLGYVTDEELLEVSKITKEVALRHVPFDVNLTKICYGPTDKKPPRMIWAVGAKSEEFASLKDDLDKSLAGSPKVRFTPEKREFSPHITLGRVRKWEWQRIEPEERPAVEEEINLSFSVNSIEVMESVLKRTGAEYTILESHNLELET